MADDLHQAVPLLPSPFPSLKPPLFHRLTSLSVLSFSVDRSTPRHGLAELCLRWPLKPPPFALDPAPPSDPVALVPFQPVPAEAAVPVTACRPRCRTPAIAAPSK